jgi:protoheme IX farnesyltransferase
MQYPYPTERDSTVEQLDMPRAAVAARPAWQPARASLGALNDYYELTTPRMNFLVVLTTMVGFYMAASGPIAWILLGATLVGTLLTASAAAVFNQYVERQYDALMARTRDRPLAAGRICSTNALVFGAVLLGSGLGCLGLWVNLLTAALGALTVGTYLLLYTPMKRRSTLNTIIGAVAGAIPPVMGWTACRGEVSAEALALFGILFLWQTPHFLAIATLYRDDYARGGFRMLPVLDRDLLMTGRQIVLYTLSLVLVSMIPAALNMTGTTYVIAAVLLGGSFLAVALATATSRAQCAARRLFVASIVYLPVLMGMMMIDKL